MFGRRAIFRVVRVEGRSLCVEDGAIFRVREMLENEEFPKLLPGEVSEVAVSGDEIEGMSDWEMLFKDRTEAGRY